MTTKYSIPSVESIREDSEDESKGEVKRSGNNSLDEEDHLHSRTAHDTSMRSHSGREREKERERSKRVHKSTASGGRHIAKPRSRITGLQRPSGLATRDTGSDGSRHRRKRSLSNKTHSSTSGSSSDEDEPAPDHRAVLAAARARLSSPSTISAFTTLTTSTNKSSGSSGSNSTVTQASITKRSTGKNLEESEVPLSPAVPDPPNVFAYLDKDDSPESQDEEQDHQGDVEDEDEDDEEEEDYDPGEGPSNWTSRQPESAYVQPPPPTDGSPQNGSSSSSASSSFHGDDSLSQPADHDTDRSTSPERSVKGKDEARGTPTHPPPTDQMSAKIAAQMVAAQQRQSLYGSMQQFGTPNMPRGNYQLPVVPPSALSARYHQQIKPHALPRAEKLPVTGYELLASRLSYSSNAVESGERIRPMYRKFEALNHRLLLHLQDEISELEEQLHRLDNADTQSRRTDRFIIPASRRAAAQAGGELQWHKTDILGRIGYKLNQYNQALASFNRTQALAPPDPEDIDHYRSYLQTEHPIAEPETHFLDPADDLVSICSDTLSRPPFQLTSGDRSYDASSIISSSDIEASHHSLDQDSHDTGPKSPLSGLAAAIAAAILIPILTFNVIPNFIGRLTVTLLVALFATFGLIQSGILDQGSLIGREGCICVGVYGGVMAVIAGVMS